MSEEVHIDWSDWLKPDSDEWNAYGVLYMYATRTDVLYIGLARETTVRARYNGHMNDDVIDLVEAASGRDRWGVQVWTFDERTINRLAPPFFHLISIVETLLIYAESYGRCFCCCNKQSTESRGKCWPEMVVVNHKKYEPLAESYYDIHIVL